MQALNITFESLGDVYSVFVYLQTDLYSGALFVQVCLGWNLYLSTVLMLVVTALYTIAGLYSCMHIMS